MPGAGATITCLLLNWIGLLNYRRVKMEDTDYLSRLFNNPNERIVVRTKVVVM